MAGLVGLLEENVWFERLRYEDAELEYHVLSRRLNGVGTSAKSLSLQKPSSSSVPQKSSLVNEIEKARENIQKSLKSNVTCGTTEASLVSRITAVESENLQLRKTTSDLENTVQRLEQRLRVLELGKSPSSAAVSSHTQQSKSSAAAEIGTNNDDDVDDDFDLFGEEEDDEDAERVKQERVKAYEDRKAKKPVLIAKSNIIFDIKPWDDETDMAELEKSVRSIVMEGLLWGSSKLVPLAYTIKKLQISCVVEDDKVSTEELEEKIMEFEDLVQSVDIAAFNKI